MSFSVEPYTDALAPQWDAWCAGAVNATLLHTRRFLAYHGERFADASVLLRHEGRLVGVLPAAHLPADTSTIASHPGATYGGIVHDGWLTGMRMADALGAALQYYRAIGCRRLVYKPLPFSYAVVPAQDDLYALFLHGSRRVRADLACTIDLAARRPPSERRRRGLKKALRTVAISSDHALLPQFWAVLERNLARKYESSPVHKFEEIQLLRELFPAEIQLRCAVFEGDVVAGVVLFNSARVWHAQYIAASELGHQLSALDAVFDHAISDAQQFGARFFDFGTSNEDAGRVLNEGLYRFKSEFGGGGVVHEYHEIDLTAVTTLAP